MTPEEAQEKAKWLNELNASGYAGMLQNGNIVDRRKHPEARPIFENKMFGIAKPKRLENNGRKL